MIGIASALVIVLLFAYLGGAAYVASQAMNIPKLPVVGSPLVDYYEDVSFPSRGDGLTLRGWFMPGHSPGEPACVIIVTGGHQSRTDHVVGTLELSRDLVDRGYSVLLFDLRGRGESDGKGLALSYADSDIGGAVDYVRNRGYRTIYIIGFSSGGALSILSGVNVTAMVIDSCFANVHEMLVSQATAKGYPVAFIKLLAPGVFLMARLMYGYQAVNPEDVVGSVTCPIFFVHGKFDDDIPLSNSCRLYQASANPLDQIWICPGADHCLTYRTSPDIYLEKVCQFMSETD